MGGGRAAGGGRRGGGQRRAGRGRGAAPARRSTWPRPARRTCSALGAPRRPVGSALRAAADRASSASAAALPRATRRRRERRAGLGLRRSRASRGAGRWRWHLVNLEGANWAFKGELVIAAERPHHWRVSKRVQSSADGCGPSWCGHQWRGFRLFQKWKPPLMLCRESREHPLPPCASRRLAAGYCPSSVLGRQAGSLLEGLRALTVWEKLAQKCRLQSSGRDHIPRT